MSPRCSVHDDASAGCNDDGEEREGSASAGCNDDGDERERNGCGNNRDDVENRHSSRNYKDAHAMYALSDDDYGDTAMDADKQQMQLLDVRFGDNGGNTMATRI